MYLYMYLLESLEFIVVYVYIEMECIYSYCISTIFLGLVFIANYIYIYSYLLDWILFSFIQYMYYKIY